MVCILLYLGSSVQYNSYEIHLVAGDGNLFIPLLCSVPFYYYTTFYVSNCWHWTFVIYNLFLDIMIKVAMDILVHVFGGDTHLFFLDMSGS